ncbi:SDR family NAD(P)-dependent oxidoreductase [Nocardiopsis akebiae]|uniref:SDR family NAD(P)-dependent oxidoreductase n=1 Tax=Nocardiopsis akebiae TaxID=2831968 RepID=A0ABX8BYA3_9ACTN|nr:SDR family NAD(P)-dependent oxidoreductase [Nocardiopsis akebiae]QUX26967.1 SDR family NAD(P)-dependent oxidoreductase [Nocardiopsis akebiae]
MRDSRAQILSSSVVVTLSAMAEAQLDSVARNLLDFVEEEEGLDLIDLAFSLQVGRAALDHRLAFVADSLDAVAEGLRAHLREGTTTGLHYGRVPEPLTWEEQDEDDRDLIRSLIAAGDHHGLARAWVGGRVVDWPLLYAPRKPYRTPLPTYPFAEERYWVQARPGPRAGAAAPAADRLHPLVHRNSSEFGRQRYSSVFTGEESFLADHRTRGTRTLPGAAYLEMALAAVADAGGSTAPDGGGTALTDVVWVRPFRVDDAPRELHVELWPNEAGAVRFEVLAPAADADADTAGPVVYCAGSLLPSGATATRLDLARLRTECAAGRLDAAEVYPAFRAAGIEYGDSFRGIDHLLLGEDQVLGRLVLPKTARPEGDGYRLHPGLLDAALQACMGMMVADPDAPGRALLPSGVERVEVFGAPPTDAWVRVRRGAQDTGEGTTRHFDLDLCDDAGHVRVSLRGLAVRAPRSADATAASAAPGTGEVLAVPRWRENPLPEPGPDASGPRPGAVFAEAGLLGDGRAGDPACEVWELTSRAPTIDARYTDYALQVFEGTRRLLRDGDRTGTVLQVLVEDRPESRLLAGLGGLLRTAGLEDPGVTGQVVIVDADTPVRERWALLEAERRVPADVTVRHRGGRREVLSWEEEPAAARPGPPWRTSGVYLITGGLGGLGRVFAEEITAQVKDATLVLTGRSPESERSGQVLERLRASGARVSYTSLDVADLSGVKALVDRVLRTYGTVHGVIHSAGVIEDDFLLRKTERAFREVLAPKVRGLVNLDEATRGIDLDFLVSFSSGAAVTGNVGQADYATANAFMDAFAEYRRDLVASGLRRGRTLSVNWPLWAEGGMRPDADTEALLLDRHGLVPLERAAGVEALERSLQTDHHQVLVASGDVARIRNALAKQRVGEDTGPVSSDEPGRARKSQDDGLEGRTVEYVTSLLSSVLKVPARRLDAGLPLERYGIDSVMAMNLTARLETVFGDLPKTLFFEYRDIGELSRYLLDSHEHRLRELLDGRSATAPEPAAVRPREAAVRTRTERRTGPETPVSVPESEDIAVIGLGGRYPQARDLREFWRNLVEGRDSVTEVPRDRWGHDADGGGPGAPYSGWGGFLDDVDRFDPLFFNMSPREAEATDPQERLFLECVYETLQDAGYTRQDLAAHAVNGVEGNVGVFVGAMYDEYQLYGATERAVADGRPIPGNAANIANRVSYFCDWRGPSLTVKTMCSSSLTALHLACQSLRLGDCEVAVAGGVNLSLHPNKYRLLEQAGFASSRGRCESFGEGGDGYVPAEGVGAVLLKRLDRAVADNDRIYGVIKSTAVNHGGRTNGYTVPNPNAQSGVITRALDKAGVDARSVSYVEAHGTGTSLGDPVEIAGLTKAFSRYTGDRQFCAIGSVKSNIGHAESAAGISALTKVLLQMRHGQLVPSLHAEVLNPHIDFGSTPFRVQRELAEWRRPTGADGVRVPRIAGISSFGAGGSNAHAIVSEYVSVEPPAADAPARRPLASVVVLSARTGEQLRDQAQRLLDWVREERIEDADLTGIAVTLQVGREHMDERLAFLCESADELAARLRDYLEGGDAAEAVYRGRVKRAEGTISSLADDEDMAHTIDAWVRKGKFGKLLELWVNGLDVPWRRFYPDPLPSRAPLPTYPFARKRFWPVGDAATGAATPGRRAPTVTETAERPAPRHEPPVPASPSPAPVNRAPALTKPRGIGLTPLAHAFGPARREVPALRVALSPTVEEAPGPRAAPTGPEPEPPPVSAPAAPDPDALVRELSATLAEALYMAEEEVDPDTNFTDLGLDSIVGVEWVKVINRRYGLDLAATRLYDAPTVHQLADYLRGLSPTESAPTRDRAPVAPAVPPGGPAAFSEQEIQADLLASLAEALYLDEDELDLDRNFTDFGLDSIVGVEWVKVINRRYGLDLAATRLYDHPTLLELTSCVRQELESGGALREGLPGVADSVPVPEPETASEAETGPGPTTASAAVAEPLPASPGAGPTDAIAVVGMSGRYPRSETQDEYWDNLANGRDCVREIPRSRWDVEEYYDPRPHQKGKSYSKWMGYLDDVEAFDPLFFHIPPAEAESMDPQQRLFLQEAYHAFEDAGYDPRSLTGHKCGVYLGIMSNEYSMLMQKRGGESSGAATSNSNAITAARIAYFLNLKGPAIALDTACSSSLVATHLAAQALRSGEIDMALVGGATLYLSPEAYVSMCGAGMLSPDGRCKAFDNGADGFVPGEGVGALVLKRLDDAERDGDHIHGVVLGSGINQDGRTNGITAPSVASQTELERDVYERHGIDPAGIGYVETHGTGTKLGDPIELEALAAVYREKTDKTGYCAIGSVKSNVGHTSAAAGMASIQKVLLCMRHEQLVPTLHFGRPNEHFDFEGSPFYVNTELKPWKTESGAARRAAVSGFGFSGTNAHLVLEEYLHESGEAAARPPAAPQVFVLSARGEEQLTTLAARLGKHLQEHPSLDPADVAHTLQQGREAMRRRLATVTTTVGELVERLTRYAEAGRADGVFTGEASRGRAGETAVETGSAPGGALSRAEAERLAAAWVGGTPVDWEPLHANARPRRVPLPTYPFARERYWFADAPVGAPPTPEVQPPAAEPESAEARPASVTEPPGGEARAGTSVLLKPVWDAVPAPAYRDPTAPSGRVVVVGGTEEHWERVRAVHPRAERLEAGPGDTAEAIAARLDATDDDLAHLIWLAPRAVPAGAMDDALLEAQESGLYACFRTLKALSNLGYARRALEFTVVTERSLRVRRADVVDPTDAGLHGLLGSVAKEYSSWTVRLVDLDPDRDWPLPQLFALPCEERGGVWAYRRGGWYRQALVPVRVADAEPADRPAYRRGGTYVVVGGAGGIGEAWTEHVIRSHAARVVWIGRREEDASIRRKLRRLGELGPEPRYVRADATDRASLERAYEDIKRTHGAVHGVIHSAIVLLDQSLERMDEERFRAAVTAKLDVSVRLAQVFHAEPLDFVLFFSSMNSFLKAPGQCNYVAGSVFEDAYAHRLASELPVPVKTMNWGYWGSVGIVAEPQYRERMTKAGAASIEPADGMAALDVLLTDAFDQLGLVRTHGGNS